MKQFKQAKTFFQTNRNYDPRLDIPVDAVVVHPHNTFPHEPEKMQDSWAARGVPVGRMFFADSDDLNEYWKNAAGDNELKKDGTPMLCSGIRPYMVPTDGWINYLRERKVMPSLKNGIQAVLPEEPLGHVFTGYEESTKRLYKEEYGCDWEDPAESETARWRIARLKALLYNRLEQELCRTSKEYQSGTPVDFIVPIHSLFSNKANQLTAPLGLSLKSNGYDGYIGQIWTGPVQWCMEACPSGTVSFFSAAFMLYDYFVQLVCGTGRKLWLLVDPVEDNPHHSWNDFRNWYQQCVTAMLMMREVNAYEVMPWPERIFLPVSFTPGIDDPADNPTPPDYFTLVLSIVQALQEMPAGGEWLDGAEECGLGIAVADSAMWQKNKKHALGGLFGLRIPLLENGIVAHNFVMERAGDAGYSAQFKTIILSYEDWTPYEPVMQTNLINWVRAGGTLIIFGSREKHSALLDELKNTGGGKVFYNETAPEEFFNAGKYETVFRPLLERAGVSTHCRSGLIMKRGDYRIVHSMNGETPVMGKSVDVFSPDLAVCENIKLAPGLSGLFKQFKPATKPFVIHTTCRLMDEQFCDGALRFTVRGPAETKLTARIYKGRLAAGAVNLPDGAEMVDDGETLKITAPNSPDGVTFEISLIEEKELCYA